MSFRVVSFVTCYFICNYLQVAQSAIIQFDLNGRAGSGLRFGNEAPTAPASGGSGGEIGAGIQFNDVSRDLTIIVGWGTTNGFTNLTGNATAMHIHTAPGPDFLNTAGGVTIGLDALAGFNNSLSAGGFNGTVNLTAVQATSLLSGAMYINVHTATNTGGEIRGNLQAVPEPTSMALIGIAGLGFAARRKLFQRKSRA